MKTLDTLYQILGVSPTADPEALKKAYRKLARRYHPDVSTEPNSHESMARINEAFETLVDPSRRAEYDAMLAGGTFESKPKSKRQEPLKPVMVRLKSRLRAHMTPIYAVAFTPDTGQLISSSFDNEILWWGQDGKPFRRQRLDAGTISTLRAFPEGRVAAAGSAESLISYWHINGESIDAWKSDKDEWVGCLAISPDGKSLASGSLHHNLAIANTFNGLHRMKTEGHGDSITAVTWSQDGRILATGSADATVKLWNGKTGEELQTISNIRSTVTSLAFSPDGTFLAVASVDYSIRVFDLANGVLAKVMFGHTKPIETLAFHPNSWLFASGSRDGSVGLWNAAKGIGNVRIDVSTRPIASVAFSPDGKYFAAGGQDKVIRIWDVTVKEPA